MRALCLIVLCAAAAAAQDKASAWVGVPLGDGRALRLSTHADGVDGQSVAVQGSLSRAGSGVFHRLLTDSSSRVVFAYDLELPDAAAAAGPVRLAVKPVSPEYARSISWPLPTFASVRTVVLSAPGERASIELLVNPKTGQKIFDVLEIVGAAGAGAAGGVTGDVPADDLSFTSAELWRNGVKVMPPRPAGGGSASNGPIAFQRPESVNAVRGHVILFYLPGLGGFFFTREEPKGYGFVKSGVVDHNRLKFTWGDDAYECVSATDILPEGKGRIWVLRDPSFKPRNPIRPAAGDRFQFGAADSAARMLGERQ